MTVEHDQVAFASEEEETVSLGWLDAIDEDDPVTRGEMLGRARTSTRARRTSSSRQACFGATMHADERGKPAAAPQPDDEPDLERRGRTKPTQHLERIPFGMHRGKRFDDSMVPTGWLRWAARSCDNVEVRAIEGLSPAAIERIEAGDTTERDARLPLLARSTYRWVR